LFGFLKNTIKRLGLEFGLVSGQVECDQPIPDMFGSQPGHLLGKLCAFMTVDRSNQTDDHVIFWAASRALVMTQSITSWSGKRSARLRATGVKRSSMYFTLSFAASSTGFARDAIDHIRRAVEKAQGIEFGKEVLKGEFVCLLHLDQIAQAQDIGRDGDAMLAGNIEHRVQPQRPFEMAVELNLWESAVCVKGSGDSFCCHTSKG
jgi:hypothetical protein